MELDESTASFYLSDSENTDATEGNLLNCKIIFCSAFCIFLFVPFKFFFFFFNYNSLVDNFSLFSSLAVALATDLQERAFTFVSSIRDKSMTPQSTTDTIVKELNQVMDSYNVLLEASYFFYHIHLLFLYTHSIAL